MKRLHLLVAATLLPLAGFGLTATSATAQEAKDIVGAWAHVSNVNTAPDGTKSDLYGPSPKGQVIYGPDGRFSIFFHRADMPKIAANNRTKGTPEENAGIVGGMVALYGSYTVVNKEIVMKVEGASYPNWVGTEQRRPISMTSPDEILMVNMGGSSGGRNDLILKRIK
jgi:Lipocalin-like domain